MGRETAQKEARVHLVEDNEFHTPWNRAGAENTKHPSSQGWVRASLSNPEDAFGGSNARRNCRGNDVLDRPEDSGSNAFPTRSRTLRSSTPGRCAASTRRTPGVQFHPRRECLRDPWKGDGQDQQHLDMARFAVRMGSECKGKPMSPPPAWRSQCVRIGLPKSLLLM